MRSKVEKCDIFCVNHAAVDRVMKDMMDNEFLQKMADIFKVLGDPNRVKIVHCLSKEELCVCDLAQVLSMSISAVSHQLRVLRDRRLVRYRREGKVVYYSLDDDHIVNLLKECVDHVNHT